MVFVLFEVGPATWLVSIAGAAVAVAAVICGAESDFGRLCAAVAMLLVCSPEMGVLCLKLSCDAATGLSRRRPVTGTTVTSPTSASQARHGRQAPCPSEDMTRSAASPSTPSCRPRASRRAARASSTTRSKSQCSARARKSGDPAASSSTEGAPSCATLDPIPVSPDSRRCRTWTRSSGTLSMRSSSPSACGVLKCRD